MFISSSPDSHERGNKQEPSISYVRRLPDDFIGALTPPPSPPRRQEPPRRPRKRTRGIARPLQQYKEENDSSSDETIPQAKRPRSTALRNEQPLTPPSGRTNRFHREYFKGDLYGSPSPALTKRKRSFTPSGTRSPSPFLASAPADHRSQLLPPSLSAPTEGSLTSTLPIRQKAVHTFSEDYREKRKQPSDTSTEPEGTSPKRRKMSTMRQTNNSVCSVMNGLYYAHEVMDLEFEDWEGELFHMALEEHSSQGRDTTERTRQRRSREEKQRKASWTEHFSFLGAQGESESE